MNWTDSGGVRFEKPSPYWLKYKRKKFDNGQRIRIDTKSVYVTTKYLHDGSSYNLAARFFPNGQLLIFRENYSKTPIENQINDSLAGKPGYYAVEWIENGEKKEGVFIPRRDTSSKLNSLAGGRFFPGIHHHAHFNVDEKNGNYLVEFKSDDNTSLSIKAKESNNWNHESIFESIDSASDFFEKGAIGYSPTKATEIYDGLELKTYTWKVTALEVSEVHSSFFENENIFPKGTVKFDNALLMRNIEHEWKGLKNLNHSTQQ